MEQGNETVEKGKGFALSWAEVPDPTQVASALKAMPQALATKLGQSLPAGTALQVPGMTPMPEAAQYLLAAPGAVTRVAVFAHGGRVYQALMTVAMSAKVWSFMTWS